MPIRKRIVSAFEEEFFKPGGKYFQRKAAIERAEKNSLRHQRILMKAERLYKHGLAKAEKLGVRKKEELLKSLDKRLSDFATMTFDGARARERLPQSPAHSKISHMNAIVSSKLEQLKRH